MIWLPILATLLVVSRAIYTKSFLVSSRISAAEFITNTTILATLIALPFAWRSGTITELATLVAEPRWWPIICAYILISTISIWQFHRGFREASLTRYQLTELLSPFFILAFVGVIFPVERDLRLYVLAALALIIFGFAHFSHRQFRFQHAERLLLLVAVLYGIEAVFERMLLVEFTPLAVFLARQVGLSITLTVLFGFHLHQHIFHRRFWGTLIASVIGFVYLVALFESYRAVGVTVTTLILLAGPVLLSTWAHHFRAERESVRVYVAGLLIMAAVGFAVFLLK